MSYCQFTSLETIEIEFNTEIADLVSLFENVAESEDSDLPVPTLQEKVSLALAINTEKARSELIVSPIPVELRK